ncbi:MAG: Fic family protein [Deltaproteobacteria bacterium HGW-Deltaproteobacteria-18]|nr:MAG: Fic family protein [Deltaproteobacteria bacterium HGW-Deltaproteobacteria-18]
MITTKSLFITPEMLTLTAQIDEFKGAWQALGSIAPERLSALRRVATIESVGSSTRIEGSALSDSDVEKLLANLAIGSFATRDEQEVAGYAETMERIFKSFDHISLTENHIRQLHRDLLLHSDKDERHRGNYKTSPNNVAAFDAEGTLIGIVFETATPFDTPRRMRELLDWTQATLGTRSLHPLLVIGIFTVAFLAIHPFQDGNGRLSRILTTLLLLRCGYAYTPFSSLESVIEQNKEGYYLALRQTQATLNSNAQDWQPWLTFFLRALHTQMQRLAAKMERERLLQHTLPDLSRRIVEHAREHGRVTIKEMTLLTGTSRNTLKEHFQRLLKNGMLERNGQGRGVWYRVK